MKTIKISGHSDDIIVVEGAITEEFTALNEYGSSDGDEPRDFLVFGDGTILKVSYDGTWRITPERHGTAIYSKKEAEGADSDNYSDGYTSARSHASLSTAHIKSSAASSSAKRDASKAALTS